MIDMHYIMGSNIAGFLPDGEPFTFDTYPEALSAMADDMRLFADEWDDSVDYREEDYRSAAQSADDGTITDAFGALLGFAVMPSTDGREWWIHPCALNPTDCGHAADPHALAAMVCHDCAATNGAGTPWEIDAPTEDDYGTAQCISCNERTLCNRAIVRPR